MKKFFAALILLTLSTTTAYAKITEQQALSDERIAPYVEVTKQQGAKLLPGRYAHVKEILSRVNPAEKIYAPTAIVAEIGNFNSENNAFPSNLDVWGENLTHAYITLDTSGAVPVMKTYWANDAGEYEVFAEDFAVVMPEDNKKYAWLLASTETGEIRYFYPLNDFWFPDEWWEEDWICADGSQISLDDGTISTNGQALGTYIISDNRIVIKTPDGNRDVIYCVYNPYNESLVMTFTSGPNGMGENAGVFTEMDDAPQAPKTQAPVFKSPAPTTSKPTFPTPSTTQTTPKNDFPTFPIAKPEANIEGVWQAYMNGQQLVLQFQGNNYYIWLNGQPAEMGSFQRDGNKLIGHKSTGEAFQNTVQVDAAGKNLILTDSNNFSMTYQRVQ